MKRYKGCFWLLFFFCFGFGVSSFAAKEQLAELHSKVTVLRGGVESIAKNLDQTQASLKSIGNALHALKRGLVPPAPVPGPGAKEYEIKLTPAHEKLFQESKFEDIKKLIEACDIKALDLSYESYKKSFSDLLNIMAYLVVHVSENKALSELVKSRMELIVEKLKSLKNLRELANQEIFRAWLIILERILPDREYFVADQLQKLGDENITELLQGLTEPAMKILARLLVYFYRNGERLEKKVLDFRDFKAELTKETELISKEISEIYSELFSKQDALKAANPLVKEKINEEIKKIEEDVKKMGKKYGSILKQKTKKVEEDKMYDYAEFDPDKLYLKKLEGKINAGIHKWGEPYYSWLNESYVMELIVKKLPEVYEIFDTISKKIAEAIKDAEPVEDSAFIKKHKNGNNFFDVLTCLFIARKLPDKLKQVFVYGKFETGLMESLGLGKEKLRFLDEKLSFYHREEITLFKADDRFNVEVKKLISTKTFCEVKEVKDVYGHASKDFVIDYPIIQAMYFSVMDPTNDDLLTLVATKLLELKANTKGIIGQLWNDFSRVDRRGYLLPAYQDRPIAFFNINLILLQKNKLTPNHMVTFSQDPEKVINTSLLLFYGAILSKYSFEGPWEDWWKGQKPFVDLLLQAIVREPDSIFTPVCQEGITKNFVAMLRKNKLTSSEIITHFSNKETRLFWGSLLFDNVAKPQLLACWNENKLFIESLFRDVFMSSSAEISKLFFGWEYRNCILDFIARSENKDVEPMFIDTCNKIEPGLAEKIKKEEEDTKKHRERERMGPGLAGVR